ncbi:MAG: ankyrin repeat domain-containing protein [Parachlamydiaceae bacterium]|nr:ankyrin repeat domain-containing protein [Parachlamydiaceae bacterium]
MKASSAIIEQLIDAGSDINAKSTESSISALCLAIKNKMEKAVLMLLAKGADLSSTDENGWTALHYAVDSENEMILKAILDAMKQNNCNLDTYSSSGNTPLHLALYSDERTVIINCLIEAGSDINVITKSSGFSVVSLAVFLKLEEAVNILIANGVDLSSTDENGWTPLHHASFYGNKQILESLLATDTNLLQFDTAGRIPLHLAFTKGNDVIVKIIVEAMKKKGMGINSFSDYGFKVMDLAQYFKKDSSVLF